MGLKCRISYRDGEAVVRDENGNLSDLYYNLLDYTKNSSDALDMWATAHSREFGEVGEAATVEDLVRYFDSSVASKESLSPSEKMQVKDFMRRNGIESLDQLNRTLVAAFKPNGIFEINPQAAVDSGLYSQDELRSIDPLTLQNLLLKIEGHLVNDNFSVEPESQRDFYKDSSAKTIFGTYERVTQDEVDNAIFLKVTDFNNIEDFYNKIKELPYEDFVTRFLEDNDFANTIINRFKGLKRIPKLSFVNGELTSNNNKVYTTVKNTLPANQDTTKIEAEIDYLNSIDEDIWQSNPELIRSVLKEVENEFTNFNVDVIGISEFPGMRAEVMAVIESANEMLNQPTEANVRTFSDNLMALVPVEDTIVVENIPDKYTAYNIVSLHTEVPENELFNSHGLIKVGDNLFHKVNQDANVMDLIDYLYDEIVKGRMSIPSEYMLTKDINNKPSVLNDISRYLMSRQTIQGLGNKELYSAYQVLFDHDPLPSKLSEAKDLAVIKTDENYLKTSFVSDFYNYILREKAANTTTYKTILSKFEITDRDITLTDTIPSIEGIELQRELEDYIRLQKDSNMKYLVPPTNEIVSEDLFYTNFPEAKSEYEGDFVMLGDFVITPKTSDNFIKINGDLYRVGLDREAGKLFAKVPKRGDSKYYTRNLNFEFDRNLASRVFDRYSAPTTNAVDYTTFKSVISRSRVNDEMSVNLKEFSTLKDKSYTFFEVNNSIVAYKDGVRVGSIRLTKTEDGFADEQISVAEIHRGKGIATELYLRLFDKIQKEDKVFYPAKVRTQAAQSVFSRLEGLLVPTTAGGFKVAQQKGVRPSVNFSQASESIKEAQIVPREAFTAILIRLTNTGLLKGRTFVEKADFSKGLRTANMENRSNAAPNKIAGFLLGDDLYINPDMLNYNTPIHEYGHLWAKWARDTRPDLYKRGTDLVKDSEYYNDILERSKDRNSVYFNYTEEKILEEALVTAIGNQGESFINKTKYNNFKQFLIDLWTSIKNAVGLNQMDPNQVSNLTLDQFAYAVAIDLLREEEFSTTTYTVPALLDQMLANKEGKLVNIQTIKQVLNQASTKKIEKDIINEVLELEYFKGKDKIPFDDFKAEVNARMMPLKVIVSSTYASYGSSNVDTGATKYETHIFNTDLDHQATGHFRPDFEATEGINFEIREMQGTFFVVEQDAVLTNENINEKVYNAASSRERAQAWIDNYDNARSINKGLFGHSRMWYNNEEGIAYGAEFQSDSYQKAKATDLLLASYNSDPSRLTEAQKPIFDKIQENKQIIDKAKKNQGEYRNVKELSEEISEKMTYLSKLDKDIERDTRDLSNLTEGSSDYIYLNSRLNRYSRRKSLVKQELEQLMNLAKGQEVTLPEMVSWTKDDPGSTTGQIGTIQLPFNEIDIIEKNTRSYKIKLGKEEATRYINRSGVAFELKKDRKPSSTISKITSDFDYVLELIEDTFRSVDALGDFRIEDYPTLNELFKKRKKGIKVSELIDVLEKELPIVSKLGAKEAFEKRQDLGLELTLLKDKGRTSENLGELDRQIARLQDTQAEVRNNRDYDRLENEIRTLKNKYWGEGILNEEDQAKYDSINEELKELNAEYSKYFLTGIYKIAGSPALKDLPLDAEIKFEVEPLRSYRLKTSPEDFYSIEEAFDKYKEDTLEVAKVDPKAYANFFNASREVTKLEDKLLDAASLRDKQFIAHRKNYTERLLREEIKRSAELGMKELRIPTPRTLALIEGYIEPEGNAPYEIVRGNENYLEPGDQIEYAGTSYYVINSDYSTIEVASQDSLSWIDVYDFRNEDIYDRVQETIYEIERVIDYEKVYTAEELESTEDYRYSTLSNLNLEKFRYSRYEITQVDDNTWRVIDTELFGQPGETVGELDSEIAANEFVGTLESKSYYFTEAALEAELEDYFESTTSTGQQFLEDFGYSVYATDGSYALVSFDSINTETFNQPDGYASSANLEDFDIEDMSSEQQTVLRKYEELNELFKANRPDATVVTDNAGNEWISTQLTVEDGTRPVVTFMEVSPSKSVENIATIFDSRLELLDLYSTKEEAEILKDINDCGA